MAGVAWLRQNAGLLRGKVVEPTFPNMDAKEQQELLERIRSSTDEEEKYPLLFTFDFQEDMRSSLTWQLRRIFGSTPCFWVAGWTASDIAVCVCVCVCVCVEVLSSVIC